MALLERVSTLVRANLNDLIDQAENPEKLLKQIILDMQNQLVQVKTQAAIAIADQHVLLKKQKEQELAAADWTRKAELAVSRNEDRLARAALEKSIGVRRLGEGYAEQAAEQAVQVESLKAALTRLEAKLVEAQAKADLLIAQHRRARAAGKAAEAGAQMTNAPSAALDRMRSKVYNAEALSQAHTELLGSDSTEEQLARMERDDEVEKLLAELKSRSKPKLLS